MNNLQYISVNGLLGAGKSVLGHTLAVALDYKYISAGQLWQAEASRLELNPSQWSHDSATITEIDRSVQSRMAELCRQSLTSVVVSGFWAWHALKLAGVPWDKVLNLYLVADMHTRIVRYAERHGLKPETEEMWMLRESRFWVRAMRLVPPISHCFDPESLETPLTIVNTDGDMQVVFDQILKKVR